MEYLNKDRMPTTKLEEQELIQDKFEMHLACAKVQRKRLGYIK